MRISDWSSDVCSSDLAKLDAIKAACQAFIGGDLLAQLSMTLADAITAAGQEPGQPRVELDADDESRQSLLLWYPSVTEAQRTQAALLTWPSSSMSSDRAVILCSKTFIRLSASR